MLAAAGELVLFSDADLSCPIEEDARLREALEKGYDVAIASRRLPGSQVDKSPRRKMMSALFNWAVQLLALPGIKDSQCGFKLFRREAAQRLFGAGAVDGWAFDVEILFLSRRLGYKICEVPVRWQESEGTRVEALPDALRMLRDIVKFRLAWQRGEYKSRLERE
jgi:dolichyl-phosphate beta-glucosyltransferase